MKLGERILILGCSGSGKSTLARKLGELLELEVIHLDRYWWQPGWQQAPAEEWQEHLDRLLMKERWIMDGNYLPSLPIRLVHSDTVIFLDFPRPLCLWRIFKRRFQYRGRSRDCIAEGCPERIDWEFLKWTWRFQKVNRPIILRYLELFAQEREIIICKNPAEVRTFLGKVSAVGRKRQPHGE